MQHNSYVRYERSVEVTQPDEDATATRIIDSIKRINQKVFAIRRHALRQAHAKSQGVLKGELTVYPDLPDHLRQGLFAQAKTYPVIVRFSSAPGDIYSDRLPSNCGMAIKVIGVEGQKADAEDTSHNHDILLVNSPVYFANPAAYAQAQRLIEMMVGAPQALLGAFEFIARGLTAGLAALGRAPPMLLRALSAKRVNILGETFHSMAAVRYGDYIAKLRAVPLSDSVRSLTGRPTAASDSAQSDIVVDFFLREAAEYEIRAQLCADLARMPVEDASVEWPEELSAPQPVAKLTLPRQEAFSPARRTYADDALSFTPWRCLDAHRPLGAIMRLRLRAYAQSSRFRHKMNASGPAEPTEISQLPD